MDIPYSESCAVPTKVEGGVEKTGTNYRGPAARNGGARGLDYVVCFSLSRQYHYLQVAQINLSYQTQVTLQLTVRAGHICYPPPQSPFHFLMGHHLYGCPCWARCKWITCLRQTVGYTGDS